MSEQLAPRLSGVQVRVRSDLKFTRQVNRDGVSYLVHHPVTFQNHRLSADDYMVLSQLRGHRKLEDVFKQLVARGVLLPAQEEAFYRYIVHLNQLSLLQLPVSDGNQLHGRFVEKERKLRTQTAKSILFLRIPLFEPTEFLDRTLQLFRPLFTRTAFFVWLACFFFCIGVVVRQFADFSDPLATMAATSNIAVLWVLLLGLKVIHEFGHAYACRHFGAAVPEMGAYFLMGSPCAYMDASDSWNLTSRRQRLIVAMGGMYFESWFAMLGVVVFCMTEPSLVNSIALYTVVLSTLITVGFNANPLMKYDGYYALADVLGRPLLREDATFELQRLVKRILFGLQIESRVEGRFERAGLILFGLACSLYRLVIAISIATVLGMFVPVLGSLVLVAYVGSTLIKLVKAGVVYLRTSPEIQDRRQRAWLASGTAFVGLLLATLLIPVPGITRTEGVVVPETQHVAYATVPGFVEVCNVHNGTEVTAGTPLVRLTNSDIEVTVTQSRAQVRDLELQLMNELTVGDPSAPLTREELRQARAALADAQDLQQQLTIVAQGDGTLSKVEAIRLKGRYVRPREPVAAVGSREMLVSTLIDEEVFSDMHPKIGDQVNLVLAHAANQPVVGQIAAIRRSASNRIEQPQLTQLGGGSIPVNPEDQLAQRPYVELRITIEGNSPQLKPGHRALVRFDQMGSTVATVCLRSMRRLFTQLGTN